MDAEHTQQFASATSYARTRRHLASFAASLAAHAALLGLIVSIVVPIDRTDGGFVAAYLVEIAGAGAGAGASAGAGAGGDSEAPPTLANRQQPRPRRTEQARHQDLRAAAAARPRDSGRDPAAPHSGGAADSRTPGAGAGGDASGTAAAGGRASGSGGGGGGDGAGAGGDRDSIAHADYARNPPPVYPPSARRRAEQGTVTVRVLVGVDGSVERVELAESSGFDALDRAALATVRSRWRFVPARRAGVAVESWVLVPIRFALVEAKG